MSDLVHVEVRGAVAVSTLDTPPGNALGRAVRGALAVRLAASAADPAAGPLGGQRRRGRRPVGESIADAILALVRSGRPETSDFEQVRRHMAWGPSPRASQAFMMAVRGRAILDGRLSPSLDDVVALAGPILRHRMALNFAARTDGVTIDQVIERLAAPYA